MAMRAFLTLMLIAALGGVSTVLAADGTIKHDPRAAFKEADANGDGFVDHEEFQIRMVEIFYAADVNKDGFLDAKELKALAFSEDFTDDDKDRNGRVSMHEFLRVRFAEFATTDTDGDGLLSVDEVVTAWEGKKHK
jgi:Ca2+-binding EF-hand superfamily protein